MNSYRSIKELVLDMYASEGDVPSYEKITALVREHFPHSRWQKSHYAWYKSQIRTGRLSVPGKTIDELNDTSEEEVEREIDDSISVRVSMERDLQSYLTEHLEELEPGLTLVSDGVEYTTEAGRIDILVPFLKS